MNCSHCQEWNRLKGRSVASERAHVWGQPWRSCFVADPGTLSNLWFFGPVWFPVRPRSVQRRISGICFRRRLWSVPRIFKRILRGREGEVQKSLVASEEEFVPTRSMVSRSSSKIKIPWITWWPRATSLGPSWRVSRSTSISSKKTCLGRSICYLKRMLLPLCTGSVFLFSNRSRRGYRLTLRVILQIILPRKSCLKVSLPFLPFIRKLYSSVPRRIPKSLRNEWPIRWLSKPTFPRLEQTWCRNWSDSSVTRWRGETR